MIADQTSDPSDIMSGKEANQATKKKFGKSERSVPHHSEKASKWYPAHTDAAKRKVSQFRTYVSTPEAGRHQFALPPISMQRILTQSLLVSQDHPSHKLPQDPRAWHRPHPPSWSLPRQACHSPQASHTRCSPHNWSLQGQWCAFTTGKPCLPHFNLHKT